MPTTTSEPTYRVAAVQMEPKLGRLEREPRVASWSGSARRPARGRTWSYSRNAPLGLRVLQPRGRAGPCRPDRWRATVRRVVAACAAAPMLLRLRTAGTRRLATVQRLRPDRSRGRDRLLSQGPSALPGDRHVRRPRRPAFAVHDAGGVRVGMHICYDGSFPETARVLSLLGADCWCCRRTGRRTRNAPPST